MKLTREENRQALKRYHHLKPARWATVSCGRRLEGSKRTCTLAQGHRGPHAAHGLFGRLLAVWGSGTGSVGAGAAGAGRSSKGTRGGSKGTGRPGTGGGTGGTKGTGVEAGRRVGPRRPVGLRSRDPGSALDKAKAVAAWVGEHAEEVFLLAFFAAFVLFAVEWLMIIFR